MVLFGSIHMPSLFTEALLNYRRPTCSFWLPFVLVITAQTGTKTGQKLKVILNTKIAGKESVL